MAKVVRLPVRRGPLGQLANLTRWALGITQREQREQQQKWRERLRERQWEETLRADEQVWAGFEDALIRGIEAGLIDPHEIRAALRGIDDVDRATVEDAGDDDSTA